MFDNKKIDDCGIYNLHIKIGDKSKKTKYIVAEIKKDHLRALPISMIKTNKESVKDLFSLKIPYSIIIDADKMPINDLYFIVDTKNDKLKNIIERLIDYEKRSRKNKKLVV